jgi:hypothetical protein
MSSAVEWSAAEQAGAFASEGPCWAVFSLHEAEQQDRSVHEDNMPVYDAEAF